VVVVVDELVERVLEQRAAERGMPVGVLAGWLLSGVLVSDV